MTSPSSRLSLCRAAFFVALIAVPVSAPFSGPVRAQSIGADWTAQKCMLYQAVVQEALKIQGDEGLGHDFLAQNEAFIAGGCTDQQSLCPVSDQEIAFADVLTVLTMNEGMASTFVPLGCPN